MKTIQTEITISAPVEYVWNVLTNFNAYATWNPFIRQIKGSAKFGEKLHITIAPEGNKTMTFKPTIISLIENQELRWVGRVLLPGIFDGEHIFMLRKISGTETLLTHKENFSGVLHKPIMKKIAASTEVGFTQMNMALKKQCEQSFCKVGAS